MVNVWLVMVSVEDDDDQPFGPYTRLQADRVAARIRDEVELATDELGGNHHPRAITYACAWPLGRYTKFLDASEKRKARGDVRAANTRTDD